MVISQRAPVFFFVMVGQKQHFEARMLHAQCTMREQTKGPRPGFQILPGASSQERGALLFELQ
jgi:hypothetical protein